MNSGSADDAVPPVGAIRWARQWSALALLLVLFLYRGFCLQILPVAAPALLADWNSPARDFATPLALIAIGTALGGVIGGFLGDARGRRLTILAFTILQGLAVSGVAFAPSMTALQVLAFVNGLCLGGYFSVGMALMTELVAPERRGFVISLAMLAGPLGLALCSLAAGWVIPREGWETLFLIGGGLAVALIAALVLFLPESPNYLARFPHRAEERRRLLLRQGLADEQPAADQAAPKTKPGSGAFRAAGRLLRDNLGATIGLWTMFFVMYLLGSVVLGWMPVVFNSLGLGIAFASRSMFYWTMGSMAATLLSGWAIGRLGPHRVGLVFGVGMVGALGAVAAVLSGSPTGLTLMLLLPLAGFTVGGVVTSLYALAAQTYPPASRASGIGLADAAGRIGGIASAYAGVIAFERGGAAGFFVGVLALGITGLVVLFLLWLRHRRSAATAAVET